MYLLPNREKKSKRKTDAKKDTVTPIFDENFEYENLPIAKLQQNLKLEVTVWDNKGVFSRGAVMGRVIIELSEIPQKRIDNQWFDLVEVDEDSDWRKKSFLRRTFQRSKKSKTISILK